MKKFLTAALALAIISLSGCFLGSDDDDDNGIAPVTESFLTENVWYFNDVDVQEQLTTNSNQTAINLLDECDGGITISGNQIAKSLGDVTLSYFHYLWFDPNGQSFALEGEGLPTNYPDYFFSYSKNSYDNNDYYSMSFSISLNDSTHLYYDTNEETTSSFDTTNFSYTVSNPIWVTNYENDDSVEINVGTIQAKQVNIPSNTPTILNTPVLNKWMEWEMNGVSLDFNSDGTLYLTEYGEIDTSLWTLDGSTLTIVEDYNSSYPDTMVLSATQGDNNLILTIIENTDADYLQYTEMQFWLDEGSLIKDLITQTLTFSHTALSKRYLDLPKDHSNRTNIQMQEIDNKQNEYFRIHKLF